MNRKTDCSVFATVEYSLSSKKKWTTDTWNSMVKLKSIMAKWKKPDVEDYMLSDSMYEIPVEKC